MVKYYLCADLKDINGMAIPCYLAHEEIDKLIEYTSRYTDDIALSKSLGLDKFTINRFYMKRNKSSDDIQNVIYKKDEDVLLMSPELLESSIIRYFKIYSNNHSNNNYDEKTKQVYEMLCVALENKDINTIRNNFDVVYDVDKNPDFASLRDCKLWEKIGLVSNDVIDCGKKYDSNILIACKRICKDLINKYKIVTFVENNSPAKVYYESKEKLRDKVKEEWNDNNTVDIRNQVSNSIRDLNKNQFNIEEESMNKDNIIISEKAPKVPLTRREKDAINSHKKGEYSKVSYMEEMLLEDPAELKATEDLDDLVKHHFIDDKTGEMYKR